MFFYDRSQWFERVACPVSSLRTYLPRHTTEGPQSYSCAQFHISEKISLRRNNRGAILFPNVSANKNSTKHTPGTRQRFIFFFFYSLLLPLFCSLFLSLSGSLWGAVPKDQLNVLSCLPQGWVSIHPYLLPFFHTSLSFWCLYKSLSGHNVALSDLKLAQARNWRSVCIFKPKWLTAVLTKPSHSLYLPPVYQ